MKCIIGESDAMGIHETIAIRGGDVILEWVNGALIASCLSALFIFLHYLAGRMCEYRWYSRMSVKAGVAITVLLTGIAILCGDTWLVRWLEARGIIWEWLYNESALLLIIGAVIKICGLLCVVRIFSPASWQRWGWRCTLMFIAAFLFVTEILLPAPGSGLGDLLSSGSLVFGLPPFK